MSRPLRTRIGAQEELMVWCSDAARAPEAWPQALKGRGREQSRAERDSLLNITIQTFGATTTLTTITACRDLRHHVATFPRQIHHQAALAEELDAAAGQLVQQQCWIQAARTEVR